MKRPNLKDYPNLTGEDSVNYIMAWNEYGNALKFENEDLKAENEALRKSIRTSKTSTNLNQTNHE